PPPVGGPWQAGVPGGRPPGDPRLADWGSRALARLIDGVIVLVPGSIVAVIIGAAWVGGQVVMSDIAFSSGERNFGIVFSIVVYLLSVAFDTVCLRRWGRTPGKAALKLRVAVVGGTGRPGEVPVAQVLVRAAVYNLVNLFVWTHVGVQSLLFLLFLVFVALWPLWDTPNRQGLHDKIGRTVVLRDR
ncbi:RDD family protein, partial [Marinitenerispora sediminis]